MVAPREASSVFSSTSVAATSTQSVEAPTASSKLTRAFLLQLYDDAGLSLGFETFERGGDGVLADLGRGKE